MNLLIGLVLLGAAYGIGSMAIDTGSWLLYLLTLVSLLLAIRFVIKFISKYVKR